jgi:S1-C subfamily serine protease
MTFLAAASFALLFAAPSWAQDDETLEKQVEQAIEKFRRGRDLLVAPARPAQDDERVKRIVDRIEKEIRESHDRTREDIRAIIRAEIQMSLGKPLPKTDPAPEAQPRKVYLGITAEDLTAAERAILGEKVGIKIADIRGPAKEAGMKVGDILVELDGVSATEERIGEILASHKPGDTIGAAVLRANKRVALKVVLAERRD